MDKQQIGKQINYCKVTIKVDSESSINAEQIRGFFGYKFLEDGEFHHHGENERYSYPKIQYKYIDKNVILLGLGEYAGILGRKIQNIGNVLIIGKKLRVDSIKINSGKETISKSDCNYSFLTPWIALNQHNYRKFKNFTKSEKLAELERILVGNILSFAKGFGFFLDFKIIVKIISFRTQKIKVNKNEFQAFYLKFNANISLPDLIGLGKSASKGFGVIKRL